MTTLDAGPLSKVLLLGLAAWLAGGSAPAHAFQGSITIAEPDRGDLLAGSAVVTATVEPPPGVAVEQVEFRVDGRLLGIDAAEPYEAAWDDVDTLRDHLIRATATLGDGTRIYELRSIPVLGLVSRATVVGDAPDFVLLSATFLDGRGEPVTDVREDEIRVYEDGRKQALELFRPDDRPLTVQLLLDASESTRAYWADLDRAAALFAGTLRPGDRAGVEAFTHVAFELAPLGSSIDAIRDATARFDGWGGGTRLYDLLARVVLLNLRGEDAGRRAAIVLTDGDDSGSALTSDEARQFIRRSDVQMYSVIWFPENTSPRGSLRKYSVVSKAHRTLEETVVGTGGDQLELDDHPLEEMFVRIGERLRSEYLLGYTSLTKRQRGKRREIEVRILRPGNYRVRYRRGHYGGDDLEAFLRQTAREERSGLMQRVALGAASARGDAEAIDLLVEVARDARHPERGAALDARQALVALGPAAVPALRDALASGRESARVAGILADLFVSLGRSGDQAGMEEALQLLGGGSRPAGEEILRNLSTADLPAPSREGLAELLGKLHDPPAATDAGSSDGGRR